MIKNDIFEIARYDEVNSILESISDSIVILDPVNQQIIYCNKTTYQSLGYTKDEFENVGSSFFSDVHDASTLSKTHQQVLSGETLSFTSKHVTKKGDLQYVDITLSPIIIANQTYICAIWNDITHNVIISKKNSDKNKRLTRFLEILSFLNNSDAFQSHDVSNYAGLATPLISSVLDIDRVSIRLYNADRSELLSISLFDRNNIERIKAKSLIRNEYPEFFNYLESNSIIVVENIQKDSSFEKMIKVFFSQDGMINSILITEIKVNTKLYGYIILQSKTTTSWDKEYILFASQIANQIGIMIIEKELKDQQSLLEKKVEERTKALEHAKDIAEKATISKTRFLSNMSHEIRTPLNAIIGFLSLIDLNLIDEKNKMFIEQIKEGSNNLLDIINDVLDISKMEAGKIEAHYGYIDLKQYFDKKFLFYKDLFINQNLIFEMNYQCMHHYYYTDENLLNMIINNLLSNALKYTIKGSVCLRINEIVISQKESHIIIEVEDTGIGIQEKDYIKIFNTFEQIDQAQHFNYKGSGLGLALTKQIIELLHGTITFQSTYQKGTTFIVSLPMQFQDITQTGSAFPEDKHLEMSYSFRGKRILIVDDNHLNQSMIVNFFLDTDAEIDVASNGYDALHYLESKTYHLVYMDLHMPRIDGIKTTQLIRLNPEFQNLKVVALTADAYQRLKNEESKHIFDEYLLKPIQKHIILETTQKVLYSVGINHTKLIINNWLEDMEKLALLNIKDGLYYVSNNEVLYETILREFIHDHSNDFDELLNVFNQDKDYAYRIVHTLRSLLKTIGMNEIYDFIIEIEQLLISESANEYILELIEKARKYFNNQLFLMKYICQIHGKRRV